ncbi:AtpZ/AtpI family protein [bacterium CPR1]|nr:AtpZ/AtpI family protein [bacterium CPR1]
MSDSEKPTRSLEEVEQRIREFKEPRKGDLTLGRGMALVFSLGFTVVALMYGSYLLGHWLDEQYQTRLLTPAMVLVGLGLAGFVGYRLMKPLLED